MANSLLKKLFGFDSEQHSLRTEIVAGATTFMTMAYILAVNPNMFGALEHLGFPKDAEFTATALAAIIGTLVMSLLAKKPFALAPGMGLNAFFVFTVCLGMGYPWQFALTAVLIEGLIFVLLTLTNVREMIVNVIPMTLKNAIGAGIGMYIAFIGLKTAGVIVSNEATSVSLGALGSTPVWLSIVGFLFTSILLILRVRGSLLIGILVITIVGIPLGVTQLNGIVDTPPSISPIFCQFTWDKVLSWDMVIAVITLLCLDLFDTIGTVVGVSVKAGMVNKEGKVNGLGKMLMSDAVATVCGACLGTNTTTTYLESASGVAEGGRTGLTSFTVAVLFVVALFFAPLFIAIPAAATSPILVIVGVMMMSTAKSIDWDNYSEAIPAFVTMLMMPLCYSISDGIMMGMISYTILNAFTGRYKNVSVLLWVLTVLFILRYIFI